MSLEGMFAELEGRMAHLESEEMRAAAEELARAERSQIALVDRLRGALGQPVTIHLAPQLAPEGVLGEVGPDWLLLGQRDIDGPLALIPLGSVTMLSGLPARSRPAVDSPIPPPPMARILRGLARDRAPVRIETHSGTLRGQIASVGADALDLRLRATGERAGSGPQVGSGLVTVPFGALLLVASA